MRMHIFTCALKLQVYASSRYSDYNGSMTTKGIERMDEQTQDYLAMPYIHAL